MLKTARYHGTVLSIRPVSIISPAEAIITTMNVVIATTALLFALPALLSVAAAIYLTDGGSPIFAHRRLGLNGRHFYCFKFRSMAVDADARLEVLLASCEESRAEWDRDHKLRNDPRVTKIGAFLRRSSLDELPQLFNVLRGEMSLVGPRPIIDAEIVRYGRRFDHYCSVKPGITGLWQVSGRNDVSYRTRVAMDTLYARRKSPLLDMWILLKTIPAVLTRRGSY